MAPSLLFSTHLPQKALLSRILQAAMSSSAISDLYLSPSPYTRFANLVRRTRRVASAIQKPAGQRAARQFARLCRPAAHLGPPGQPTRKQTLSPPLLPIDRSLLIAEEDDEDEPWYLLGASSTSKSLGSSSSKEEATPPPHNHASAQPLRTRPILSVDTSSRTVRTAPWEGYSQGFHAYKSLREALHEEGTKVAVPTWTCLDISPQRVSADSRALFECMVRCSVQEASRSGKPIDSVVPLYCQHFLSCAVPRGKRSVQPPDVRVEARPSGAGEACAVFLAHGRVLQTSGWPHLQALNGSSLVVRAPARLVFSALQHAYLSTVGERVSPAPLAEEQALRYPVAQKQNPPANVYHDSGSLFLLACENRLPLLQAYLVEKADCLRGIHPACPLCACKHGPAAQLVSLVSLTALCREEGVLLGDRVMSLVAAAFCSFDTSAFCKTYERSCQQGCLAILESLNGTPLEAVDVFIGPGRCGSTSSACCDDARATFLEVWSAANHKNLVGQKLCIKKMIAKTINNMSLSRMLAERLVSPDGANSNMLSACIDSPKVQEVVKKTFWATVDHSSLVLEAYGQAGDPPLVLCLPPPSLTAFFSPDTLHHRWLWVTGLPRCGRVVLGQCGVNASFCATVVPVSPVPCSQPGSGFRLLESSSVFDGGHGGVLQRSCWTSWPRDSACRLRAPFEDSMQQGPAHSRGSPTVVRFPVWERARQPPRAETPTSVGSETMLFCVISEDPLDRLILSDFTNPSGNEALDHMGLAWEPRRVPSPSTVCSIWREQTDWDGTVFETELESWTLPGLYEDCSSILWAAVCRERKTVIGWSAVPAEDGLSDTGALFVCADQHSRLFPDYTVSDVFLVAPGAAQLWQGFDDDLLPSLVFIDESGSLCVLDVCDRKLAHNDSLADFCEPAAVSAACIQEKASLAPLCPCKISLLSITPLSYPFWYPFPRL